MVPGLRTASAGHGGDHMGRPYVVTLPQGAAAIRVAAKICQTNARKKGMPARAFDQS